MTLLGNPTRKRDVKRKAYRKLVIATKPLIENRSNSKRLFEIFERGKIVSGSRRFAKLAHPIVSDIVSEDFFDRLIVKRNRGGSGCRSGSGGWSHGLLKP